MECPGWDMSRWMRHKVWSLVKAGVWGAVPGACFRCPEEWLLTPIGSTVDLPFPLKFSVAKNQVKGG